MIVEMNAAQRRRLAEQLREAARREIESGARSQNRIASDAEIDRGSLSRFLAGERGLSLEAIERLTEALNLHLVEKKPRKKK